MHNPAGEIVLGDVSESCLEETLHGRLSWYFRTHPESWMPGMAIIDDATETVFRFSRHRVGHETRLLEWGAMLGGVMCSYTEWPDRQGFPLRHDFQRASHNGPWLDDPATIGAMLMEMPQGSVSRCSDKDTGWDAEYNDGTGWRVFHQETREDAVIKAWLAWKEAK